VCLMRLREIGRDENSLVLATNARREEFAEGH